MAFDFISMSMLESGIGGVMNFLLITFIMLCLVVIIWFVWWFTRYKHTAHIMNLTGSVLMHEYDKARVYKDKHGILWLKLFKRNHTDRVPPAEGKGLTKKGRFHFDLYYTEEDGYTFASQNSSDITRDVANMKTHKVPKLDEEGKPVEKMSVGENGQPLIVKGKVIMEPVYEELILPNMMPWSTAERSLYVQQQHDAMMWKKDGLGEFFNKHGSVIVVSTFLIIMAALMFMMLDSALPAISNVQQSALARATEDKLTYQAIVRALEIMNGTPSAGIAPG